MPPSAPPFSAADALEQTQWDFFWIPPDAAVVDKPELLFVHCPRNVPTLNCVTRTRAPSSNLPTLIDEVSNTHENVTSRWLVRDFRQHAALPAALSRAGYLPTFEYGAFAAPTDAHRARTQTAVSVKRVRDIQDLRDWYRIADAAFGHPATHSDGELATYLHECTKPNARVRRFVAYAGEEPVSCGGMSSFPSLQFGCLWAGATLASARGHGYYRAILDARIAHAKHLGIAQVGLYARLTTSGPIVTKLGFLSDGTMVYWERPPPSASIRLS